MLFTNLVKGISDTSGVAAAMMSRCKWLGLHRLGCSVGVEASSDGVKVVLVKHP